MQPFAPAGSITSLFGKERISPPLERLTGSTLPAFITHGGYSSVEFRTFTFHLTSSSSLNWLSLPLYRTRVLLHQLAWFVNADWKIGDPCGFLQNQRPNTYLSPLLSPSKIHLNGAIEQPFARIQYVWVHDDNQLAGLTREEIEQINIALPNDFILTFTEKKPI